MATKIITPTEQHETLLNLTPEDVAKRITKIKNVGNTIAFELGVLIKRVRDEQLWKNWETVEYPSFAEWVFKVLGKNVRTAQYYIEVNEKLNKLKLDDEWMRKAIQLGWVKLLQILKVAETTKQFKMWYAKALNQGERSLKADVKQAQIVLASENPDSDNNIMIGADGEETLAAMSDEEKKAISVDVQFHKVEEWEHFNKAMEVAEKVCGTQHNGKLIDHISTYYLAHSNTQLQGGLLMDVNDILLALVENHNLPLAVLDPETNEWIPVKKAKSTEKQSKTSSKKSKVPLKGNPPKKKSTTE